MAGDADAVNGVRLDRLQDHDLLVRIATRLDSLPCVSHQDGVDKLEGRVGALEQALAAMRVQGGVLAAVATAVSTLAGIFVKP